LLGSTNYSLQFSATGGTPPYTWAPLSPLPSGLILSRLGALASKPTKAGTTTFAIRVTDNGGLSNAALFSLTVVDGAAPFAALAGTYTGLILQTNLPTQASSGSVQIRLTKTGAFAGNLTRAGVKTAFTGQFDRTGNATNLVAGASVALHVDMVNDNGPITGTVTGSGFTAELLAALPGPGFTPAVIAELTGTSQVGPGAYTLVFSPADPSTTNVPQGYGYATLIISRSGNSSLSGVLNDGTKLTANAPVSQLGLWPLFVSSSKNTGVAVGWVSFETNTLATATVDWFAPASPGYAAFTTTLNLIGSKFVANQSVDGNSLVTLSGGGLTNNISKTVTINNGKAVVTNPGPDALTLKFNLTTGKFTGTFIPVAGSKPLPFSGLLLQAQQIGAGLFQTTAGQTGSVTIEPLP